MSISQPEETGRQYSIPELYDIAFDFRDIPSEVDFLLERCRHFRGVNAKSTLELACGPAYHVREMARRKLIAHGLDLEPAMVTYAQSLIDKAELDGTIFESDMRHFDTGRNYDLIYILMASFAHLRTNRDIVDNLNCVADHLTDGGIFIISTAHPRDFYGDEPSSTQNSWSMSRGDVSVETSWGDDSDTFDPLTEIDNVTIQFAVTTPEGTHIHRYPDRLRRLSIMTFYALVELSGRFEIVDQYGALTTELPLTNDRECWRFVPILQKKS